MSNPTQFQPLGRIPHPAGGRPTFRIIVLVFVALHAVFFAGVLLPGCRPKTEVVQETPPTNGLPAMEDLFRDWDRRVLTPGEAVTTPRDPVPPPATNALLALGDPGTGRTQATRDTTPSDAPGTGLTPAQQLVDEGLPADTTPGRTGERVGLERQATEDLAKATEHTVVSGDSFWSIAQKYGVTVQDITGANPGVEPTRLPIDRVLVIPPPRPAGAKAPDAPPGTVHRVQRGQTLSSIARDHGVTVEALRQENNLRTDRIFADQTLRLPVKPKN